MGSLPFVVGQAAFDDQVVKAKMPVLVDFFAEWCGPCQAAVPILEALAEEFAGKVTILKIDTDNPENRPLSQAHGVMSIPTVVVYKDGKPLGEPFIGFNGEQGYRQLINNALAQK